MKLKKILVPVDFSEFSDYAVDNALFLAEKFDAEVTLLHAVVLHVEEFSEQGIFEGYEELVKKKEKRIFRRLNEKNESAAERGVTVNSRVVRGFSAAESILEFINENHYDLVVMGTHGRRGIKKWVFGSVAERIVRLSPIPVMTVHEPMKKYAIEKILVPVEFSKFGREAVNNARVFAELFGARLDFIHVVEQRLHPAYYAGNIESVFSVNPKIRTLSADRLAAFAPANGNDVSYLVTEGQAFDEILRAVDNLGSDLIIMATRGLTGLDHFLVGSTTERVVRLANVPVLTVGRERSLESGEAAQAEAAVEDVNS